MLKIFCAFLCTILMSPLTAKTPFVHGNPCATHQHVLYEMTLRTKGPIIEFGCGYGSTPLLHELCKKTGRLLITLDDDKAWLKKFAHKYRGDGYSTDNSGWHKFYFVPNKNPKDTRDPKHWNDFLDTFELLKQIHFDICFVDQAPFTARLPTMQRLKGISKYVIVHDCDDFIVQKIFGTALVQTTQDRLGIYDFHEVFRYFKVYAPIKPWPLPNGPCTLLGSDFESVLPEIDAKNYLYY